MSGKLSRSTDDQSYNNDLNSMMLFGSTSPSMSEPYFCCDDGGNVFPFADLSRRVDPD